MSPDPPERDPFLDDEAAREREARRREREARRAQRGESSRRSLGERVSGALGGAEPQAPVDEGTQSEPPADPEPQPPIDEAIQAEVPADPEPPPRQPAAPAPAAGRPAAPPQDQQPKTPEPTAGEGVPVRGAPVPRRRRPAAGGPLGQEEFKRRRLLAGGAVLGVIALLVAVLALGGGGASDALEEQAGEVAAEPAVEVFTLTIPEGLGRAEIAKLAKKSKLKGSYDKASKKAPKGFSLKEYGAEGAPNLEGFLFPATYELEKRAPSADLVAKQVQAFEDNLAQVNLKKAEKANLTPYDVVIIASMIEREVSVPEERELVSAVIYNRLRDGEPLGIDATLRYELGDFDTPLLESELAADTAYNTRINAGLPPTPIGNPGLASLEAAANPANKDFRFYVIKPGTCNEHFFTADPAEFEEASAEYQAALEAEGGSPTEC